MSDKLGDSTLSVQLRESGELEGGLFVEISLTYCGRDYVSRKDYYTVKGGIVFCIIEDKLWATGDSLWSLKRDCHRVGKYNPKKIYKYKARTYTYSEIKKLLKL